MRKLLFFLKKKTFHPGGFTMLELLVSLSIIFVLISVFFANYRQGNRQANLDMAAQKLMSDIRMVETYALGLKTFKGATPAGGWGIFFQGSDGYYTVFADATEDENPFMTDSSELFQEINIQEQNVAIASSIGFTCGGTDFSRSYAYLVFSPPEPKIIINGDNIANMPTGATVNCEKMEITLTETATNATRVIEVNKFGLIDARN